MKHRTFTEIVPIMKSLEEQIGAIKNIPEEKRSSGDVLKLTRLKNEYAELERQKQQITQYIPKPRIPDKKPSDDKPEYLDIDKL